MGYRGTFGVRDHHLASRKMFEDFTEGALTIAACNVILMGPCELWLHVGDGGYNPFVGGT